MKILGRSLIIVLLLASLLSSCEKDSKEVMFGKDEQYVLNAGEYYIDVLNKTPLPPKISIDKNGVYGINIIDYEFPLNVQSISCDAMLMSYPNPSITFSLGNLAGQETSDISLEKISYSHLNENQILETEVPFEIRCFYTGQLEKIKEISFDMPIKLTLYAFEPLYITKGSEIHFPEMVSIEKDKEDTQDYTISGNSIIINRDLSLLDKINIDLLLKSINVGDEYTIQHNGLSLDMKLKVTGDMYLYSKDYKTLPETLYANFKYSFDSMQNYGRDRAKSLSGVLKQTYDQFKGHDVGIYDILSFPEDKGVVIDQTSPVLNVRFTNDFLSKATLSTDLCYHYTNEYINHIDKIFSLISESDKIDIPSGGSSECTFICNEEDAVQGTHNFMVPQLHLIADDIDKTRYQHKTLTFRNIKYELAPEVHQYYLKQKYCIKIHHSLSVPLLYNTDPAFTLIQNILEKTAIPVPKKSETAIVTMDITNNMPMEFKVEAMLRDKKISDLLTLTTGNETIKAGKVESPVSSCITFEIPIPSDTRMISGFELRYTSLGKNKERMKDKHKIAVRNISVRIE